MIKSIKKMMAVMAAVCLAGAFTACSSGDGGDDPFKKPAPEFETEGAIGNVIEFKVTEDTTGTSNKITLKYRRSAAGAPEKITLQGAKFNLWKNGDQDITKKSQDIAFTLNEYGSCFCFAEGVDSKPADCTGDHYDENGKIKNLDDCAEYQCELTYSNKLVKGDVVKFQLVSATVTGEAAATASTEILPKIKAVLIDAAEAVKWYKEVFEYTKENEGGEGYPKVFKSGAKVDEGEEEDHGLLDSSFNTGEWAGAAFIEPKVFEGVQAGAKLVITYEKNNDGAEGYWMFQICDGADVKTKYAEVSAKADSGVETYAFKSTDVANLEANGVKIQGNGITITKIELIAGDGNDPDPEPEPEYIAILSGWDGAKVEGLTYAEGSKVVVTYKDKAEGGAFKIANYSWEAFTTAANVTGGTMAADGAIAPDSTEGTITYVMTSADVEAALYNQLVFQGDGVTIVSVTIE